MGKKKQPFLVKLIYNPGAGKAEGTSLRLEQVTRCLQAHGFTVKVAVAHPNTRGTAIARKAARAGYRLVVAFGGDGTIEAVARGLVKTKTRLGILPDGTYNNLAKSLGIPQDLETACALLENGACRRIDVGQIKTKQHGKYAFLELAAVGLVATLYPDVKRLPKGQWTELAGAIEKLALYPAHQVDVRLGSNRHVRAQTMLVTVSNAPIFGANFLLAPEASLEDGLLDVHLFPDFSKAELITYFAEIARERSSDRQSAQHYQAHQIRIKARPKMAIMADGVMLGKGKAKIKVLRGALRVIAPAGAGEGPAEQPEAKRGPAPMASASSP